jgi:hypothetical protein
MGIAFKNVRTVTTQLETLTTQSGEALDVARKCACAYWRTFKRLRQLCPTGSRFGIADYGMYVALLKTMDRMQKVFVDKVDREYVPNLRKFRRESEVGASLASQFTTALCSHGSVLLVAVCACECEGHHS